MLYKEASAEGINESNLFLHESTGVKIGDACICLNYCFDPPTIGKTGEKNFVAGTISVYSNGFASCLITEDRYRGDICADYEKLNGKPIDEMMNSTQGYYECTEKDPSRWSRIKQFIADNNIKLERAEDLAAERADYTKMPHEEDEEDERISKEGLNNMTGAYFGK